MMIFFDIDETLLDQRRAERSALAYLLDRYADGLPEGCTIDNLCITWRELREKHARAFLDGKVSFREQRRRRVRELFVSREPHLSDNEVDRRLAVYAEHYHASWALFDDVLPCLSQLSRYTLGVISNGSSDQQRRKLVETGIDQFFSFVFISEDLGAAKPKAAVFRKACRIADRKPKDCIYVGDRLESDALSSSRAGLRGIWLRREGPPVNGTVEVISSLSELPDRLQQKAKNRRIRSMPAVLADGPQPLICRFGSRLKCPVCWADRFERAVDRLRLFPAPERYG